MVHQLLKLFFIFTACQANSQFLQRVFQIAVVVEVFNQKAQGAALHFRQAQRQCLLVQMVRQRFVAAGQFQCRRGILVLIALAACRCFTTPLCVIQRPHVYTAIALPVLGQIGSFCHGSF